MSEQRRMEYLDALGIEQFIPRKRLLGAKSSLALIRVHSPVETTPATKGCAGPIELAGGCAAASGQAG